MSKSQSPQYIKERAQILIFVLILGLSPKGLTAESISFNIKSSLCLSNYNSLVILPQNSASELPEEAVAAIKKHRLAYDLNRLRNTYGGHNITFRFPIGFNADGSLNESTKGEGQQGMLVKSILNYVVPDALFTYGLAAEALSPIKYDFRVFDTSEAGRKYHRFPPLSIIEMSLLKSGNPFRFPVSRLEAKKILGLEDKKVVHIYIAWTSTLTVEKFQSISNALKQKLGDHLLIISFGNGSNTQTVAKEFAHVSGYNQFVELSKLKKDNFSKMSSGVVYNDTIGNMPFLYAASDLAVVVGPVNFFQPLVQGTRTFFVFPEEARVSRGYNKLTIYRMSQIANKTNGFVRSTDFKSVPEDIDKLLKKPEPIHPAFTKTKGTTYFTKILDRMLLMILNQH